jgi:hypothetical protein
MGQSYKGIDCPDTIPAFLNRFAFAAKLSKELGE